MSKKLHDLQGKNIPSRHVIHQIRFPIKVLRSQQKKKTFLKNQNIPKRWLGASLMKPVKGDQVSVDQGEFQFTTFKFGAGEGTYTRAEKFALCLLFKFASEAGLSRLKVMGDSKVIIDWANVKSRIENLALNPILDKIKELIQNFS